MRGTYGVREELSYNTVTIFSVKCSIGRHLSFFICIKMANILCRSSLWGLAAKQALLTQENDANLKFWMRVSMSKTPPLHVFLISLSRSSNLYPNAVSWTSFFVFLVELHHYKSLTHVT